MKKPLDVFPLKAIVQGLDGYSPPLEAFDPEEDWKQVYFIHTLSRACQKTGEICLTRTRGKQNRFTLHLLSERWLPENHIQSLEARLVCSSDPVSTPVSWTYQVQSLDPSRNPIPGTVLSHKAECRDGEVLIETARHHRRVFVDSGFTINWALFDAVQRLPREAFDPLHFTLLDHFDQVKPEYRLSFRGMDPIVLGTRKVLQERTEDLEKGRVSRTQREEVGGEPHELYAYDLVGCGNVPWVFWTDTRGRLLFVVAGLEAYIWQEDQT